MPDKPSAASRTTRRKIDLAPNPFETQEPTAEPVAPTSRSRKQSPAKVAPAKAPAVKKAQPVEPPPLDPDLKVGEERWAEGSFKLTVNIPNSLYRRATGIVLHSQITGEPAEVASLTDLIRLALAGKVSAYEKKFNDGAEFPAPKSGLRRGRR